MSLVEYQFGRGESIATTKLWITFIAVVVLIHASCRLNSTDHNFPKTRFLSRVLYWPALPIAVVCLGGGGLVFFVNNDIGSLFLSLASLKIGIFAAMATTAAIAIELLSTTRPDMMRCGAGIAIAVIAMGVSLLFGMPV